MGCGSSSQQPRGANTNDRAASDHGAAFVPQSGSKRVGPSPPWRFDGGQTITEFALHQHREEFWETAKAEGSTIVWEALKVAAEAMLKNDYQLANTILEASDIRTPTGSLDQCWDSTGRLYRVPKICFSLPTNLATGNEVQQRAKHSGPVQTLSMRIRISSSRETTEQNIQISVQSDQSIKDVKEAIHAALCSGEWDAGEERTTDRPNRWAGRGLPAASQRCIYRGRVLGDDLIVQQCGFKPEAFLQVFIRE